MQQIIAQIDPHIKTLLRILNAYAIRNDTPVAGSFTIEEFSQLSLLSAKHKTNYHLFTYFLQYQHLISPEQLLQLRDKMTRQAKRSLRQLNELLSLCSSLNNRGIRYAIIKGPHMARMLYGKEAVKVSVDLDILMVDPDDLPAFHEVFITAGYTCFEQRLLTSTWKQRLFVSAKREVHYFNRNTRCAIDLHVKPLANTIITRYRCSDFFSDLRHLPFEGITIPVLPPEKYFVYLCHHGACHMFSHLGWLLDIRNFFNQQKEMLSIEKILSVAGSINTERSVYLAFYLLEDLFNVAITEKIKRTMGCSKTIEWLALNCLKAISYQKGGNLTLKARFDRIIYLVRLTRGITGKVDVVLGVSLRHLVLILFKGD